MSLSNNKSYDFSKPSIPLLYDLVNHSNATMFEVGQLLVSEPSRLEDGRVEVELTPAIGSGLNGRTVVRYYRADIGWYFDVYEGVPELELEPNRDFAQVVVEALLEEYNIFLDFTQVDVVAFETPDTEDPSIMVQGFTITPHEDHLIWQGSVTGVYTFLPAEEVL